MHFTNTILTTITVSTILPCIAVATGTPEKIYWAQTAALGDGILRADPSGDNAETILHRFLGSIDETTKIAY